VNLAHKVILYSSEHLYCEEEDGSVQEGGVVKLSFHEGRSVDDMAIAEELAKVVIAPPRFGGKGGPTQGQGFGGV
jgi:hypothetical protein